MKANRSERGQTLVLVILAVVAIMGFTALAVDGGQLYSERRRAQNAADAGALAAAKAASLKKTETEISSAVNVLTNKNGFNNDGSTNIVAYNHPPAAGSAYAGNNEYYQVVITQKVQPIFSQFVFQGAQAVTVESVARARNVAAASGTNAMMSMHTSGTGIDILGNASITIHGGNMWSNSDGVKKGNAGDIWVYKNPDLSDTTLGQVVTVGSWTNTDKMHADFVSGATAVSYPDVPVPYCPSSYGKTTLQSRKDGVPIPGVFVDYYVWGDASHPVPSNLPAGINCVHGDIVLQGSQKDLQGSNVLLVMLDGGIQSKGGGLISLSRFNGLIDYNGNQWGGMVMFAPETNHSEMDFGGNSDTLFNGTLFVPGMTCDIGGTPAGTANHAAFICDNWKIHGNPDVKIIYNPVENWRLPPAVELSQ